MGGGLRNPGGECGTPEVSRHGDGGGGHQSPSLFWSDRYVLQVSGLPLPVQDVLLVPEMSSSVHDELLDREISLNCVWRRQVNGMTNHITKLSYN